MAENSNPATHCKAFVLDCLAQFRDAGGSLGISSQSGEAIPADCRKNTATKFFLRLTERNDKLCAADSADLDQYGPGEIHQFDSGYLYMHAFHLRRPVLARSIYLFENVDRPDASQINEIIGDRDWLLQLRNERVGIIRIRLDALVASAEALFRSMCRLAAQDDGRQRIIKNQSMLCKTISKIPRKIQDILGPARLDGATRVAAEELAALYTDRLQSLVQAASKILAKEVCCEHGQEIQN